MMSNTVLLFKHPFSRLMDLADLIIAAYGQAQSQFGDGLSVMGAT